MFEGSVSLLRDGSARNDASRCGWSCGVGAATVNSHVYGDSETTLRPHAHTRDFRPFESSLELNAGLPVSLSGRTNVTFRPGVRPGLRFR